MMKKNTKIIILIVVILLIVGVAVSVLLSEGTLNTKGDVNITDVAGRTVQVPANPEKVLGTSPSSVSLMYMLAPEKLAGIPNAWNKEELPFIPDAYKNLPEIGGWYGKNTGNYEEYISANPDFVVESINPSVSSDIDIINERQSKMGDIPVVAIYDTSDIDNNTEVIAFVGKILGKEDQAKKLIDFNQGNLDKVKKVASSLSYSDKVSVYYAEDANGLKTEGPESDHTQLIRICGGRNVVDTVKDESTQVSIEQVIAWNPDKIITTNHEFYDKVYSNPQWAQINAVKNHEVYLSPDAPFTWFDKPVGLNNIMGVPWTAKVLYPNQFDNIDLIGDTQYFYKNFYHFDLSKEQAKEILLDSGLKEKNL